MEGGGIESIVVVICGRFFTCRINEGRMIVQEIVKKKKKNREPVRFNINFIREKQCNKLSGHSDESQTRTEKSRRLS